MGPIGRWAYLVLAVLVVFSALCTVFALVMTVAQAWEERNQARWPEAVARVDQCALTQRSIRERERYYILCRLRYAVGAQQNAANVYSLSVPSREIWQYPPNQIAPYEQWVSAHPPGTPIVVRYNPTHPAKVVLVEDFMPRGGPHTPANLKLLAFCAGSFLVLLLLARMTRPRVLQQLGSPS
jgi:hypothetical protein